MSNRPKSQYADRDPVALEPHYSVHVAAMTREELQAKARIAAELAWRDAQIAELLTLVLRARRFVALDADASHLSDSTGAKEWLREAAETIEANRAE